MNERVKGPAVVQFVWAVTVTTVENNVKRAEVIFMLAAFHRSKR